MIAGTMVSIPGKVGLVCLHNLLQLQRVEISWFNGHDAIGFMVLFPPTIRLQFIT